MYEKALNSPGTARGPVFNQQASPSRASSSLSPTKIQADYSNGHKFDIRQTIPGTVFLAKTRSFVENVLSSAEPLIRFTCSVLG